MIDWNKIADEKTFQRLINHLFALECNSPGFIPSSPYIGADGSWDGYFKGFYPHEKLKGTFSIQSKWTQKSFTPAASYLTQEIKKELKSAKKNSVEHLRIATNAEFKVSQVRKLELLNKGMVKTLKIWHRESLAIRIEQQSFLLHFFFGNPKYPMFVPTQIYFKKIEPHLIAKTHGKVFKNQINQFKQFVLKDESRLLLVHAPAGFGKSHLLRQMANISHKIDPSRQPFLIRCGYRSIENALQEEILQTRKYLFFLDDVDREESFKIVRPLLLFMRTAGIDTKIIFASRSSGTYLLKQEISECRCTDYSEELTSLSWSKDDFLGLLRQIVGRAKVKNEERIVTAYPNPYLIVLIGLKIKNKSDFDFLKLKNRLVDDIISDTRRCLYDISIKNTSIERLLFNLSSIVPFLFDNKTIITRLSSDIDLDKATLEEALNRLLKSGVLRKIGRTIRFNPDIKGDLFLQLKLAEYDKNKLTKILLDWLQISPHNLLVNINAASSYGISNNLKQILSEMLQQWSINSHKTPGSQRREYLKLVEKIATIVPEETKNLLSTYLETAVPEETNDLYKIWGNKKTILNTDDYGPIILELMRLSEQRKAILPIIMKMEEVSPSGTYDTYQTLSLIRRFFSPLHNSTPVILLSLKDISEWASDENEIKQAILKTVLSELLSGTHEFTQSYADHFTIGERALQNRTEVLNLRREAINILKEMLHSKNVDLQINALNITRSIGKTKMGRVSETDIPLAGRIRLERKQMLDEIGSLFKCNNDFRLLNAIENLLIQWWAEGSPGTKRASDFLINFHRPPKYIVFRYFVSSDYAIEDFSEISKKALPNKRWEWFIENIMHRAYSDKPIDFSYVLKKIKKTIKTKKMVIFFLKDLFSKISYYSTDYRLGMLFLHKWVTEEIKTFSKIRNDNALWKQVPNCFKVTIDDAIAKNSERHLYKLADEIMGNLSTVEKERIFDFLYILSRYVPPPIWKNWVKELIEKGDTEIRESITRVLFFLWRNTKDTESIIKLIIMIVSKEKHLSISLIDNIDFAIKSMIKEPQKLPPQVTMLKKLLLKKLRDLPKLTWHADELLAFCLTDKDSVVAFLEYRFVVSKKNKTQTDFEAIPYNGLRFIDRTINTQKDYSAFMKEVVYWYLSDPSWKNFYLKYLMKDIALKRSKKNGALFLVESINKMKKKNIKKALICANFLPLNIDTIDCLINLCNDALSGNLYNEVRSFLLSKTLPEDGYSSSLGQPPAVFVEKKKTFEQIGAKIPAGQLKTLINECIQYIQITIDDHLKRDEEFLNQKG